MSIAKVRVEDLCVMLAESKSLAAFGRIFLIDRRLTFSGIKASLGVPSLKLECVFIMMVCLSAVE